jgi:hypothetical protein
MCSDGRSVAHFAAVFLFILSLCSGVHCPSAKVGVPVIQPPAGLPTPPGRGGLPQAAAWARSSSRRLARDFGCHLGGSVSRGPSVAAVLWAYGTLHPNWKVSWSCSSVSLFISQFTGGISSSRVGSSSCIWFFLKCE